MIRRIFAIYAGDGITLASSCR
nr:hypothetical protein BOSE7B_40007 [Bosea sp. 7B]